MAGGHGCPQFDAATIGNMWGSSQSQTVDVFSSYPAPFESAPQSNFTPDTQIIGTSIEHSSDTPKFEPKLSSSPEKAEKTENVSDPGNSVETDRLEGHDKLFDNFLQNNAMDVGNVMKIVSILKNSHSVLVRNKSSLVCPFLAALENNIIRPETGSPCNPYHLTISSTDTESEFQLTTSDKKDNPILIKQEPRSDMHGLFPNNLVSFDSSSFGSGLDNVMGSLTGTQFMPDLCLDKIDKKPDKKPRGRPPKKLSALSNKKTKKRESENVSEEPRAKQLKLRLRKSTAKNIKHPTSRPGGRPNLISRKLVGSIPTANVTREEKIARRKKIKALYNKPLTGMWLQFPELNSPVLR